VAVTSEARSRAICSALCRERYHFFNSVRSYRPRSERNWRVARSSTPVAARDRQSRQDGGRGCVDSRAAREKPFLRPFLACGGLRFPVSARRHSLQAPFGAQSPAAKIPFQTRGRKKVREEGGGRRFGPDPGGDGPRSGSVEYVVRCSRERRAA